MPIEYHRQTSFAAGELAPKLHGRSDWEGYTIGSAAQPNFLSMIEGGAEFRPGLFRLGEAMVSPTGDPLDRSRLIPFHRSVTEGFMLELAHQTLRIWSVTSAALVKDDTDAEIVLTTPWPKTVLARLTYIRQGDIMIICDGTQSIAPQIVRRDSATSWSISAFDFRNGPLSRGSSDITASLSGTSLSFSQDVLKDENVGSTVRLIENPSLISTTKWQVDTAVTSGELREFSGRVYRAASTGDTGTAPPIHEEGRRSDGNINWIFVHDGGVFVTIAAVNTARSATVSVNAGNTAPAATSSTPYWSISAFNDFDGWPSNAMFHHGRIWFTGSVSEPDTLHGSVVNDYDPFGANFNSGLASGQTTDDDAVTAPLANGSVDPIAWLLSTDGLVSGGAGGVRTVRGPGRSDVITPAGSVAVPLAGYGADIGPRGIRIGDYILYSGIGGRVLRAVRLDGEEIEASRHSNHLLSGQIYSLDWEISTKTLWIVTGSGRLVAFTYEREQGVEGMCPIQFADNGLVETLAVGRRPDGVETVWAIVRYRIGDQVFREVSVLTRRWFEGLPLEQVCYLDRAGYFDANAPVVDPNPDPDPDPNPDPDPDPGPGTGTPSTPPDTVVGGTGSGDDGPNSGNGSGGGNSNGFSDEYRLEQY